MAKEDSKISQDINQNLESPGEIISRDKKFWKENISNDDLLRLYRRKGIVFRTVNKQTKLMFKNGWVSDDETANKIGETFDFDNYVKYSYKNSLISGYSLIYVDYGDIQTDADYETVAPSNKKAIGYFVITKAWVHRDKYDDQTIYDNYEIYKADGHVFTVHESRFIRVQITPEGIGMLEPAYDSLMVLDNVLWGLGQTMYRSGSGFPVMKVKDGMNVVSLPNGDKMTRMQYYKKVGVLRDMNTQTGIMIDEKDTFTFEGAQGKAINPGEYYDRAFQQCAVDLDVPVDILKGVAAGAVTGSETNIKEYLGDLAAKQESDLTPIYEAMFETQNYVLKEPINYKPIFEQSQKDISENLVRDVKAIYELELYGYFTHEQAVIFFAENYPSLKYDDKEINALKNLEVYESKAGFSFAQSSDGIKVISNDETSTLPKKTQSIESKYQKEMDKAFKDSQKNITLLLQAKNTD